MYLLKDQKRATQSDWKTPFENQKDVLKRLVPFHVFQTRIDTDEQIEYGQFSVERIFSLCFE